MKKFLLSIFAVLFAFAGAQAQELVYTLEPVAGTNYSYAGNCDITIGGITWNLTGNSQTNPWRIGGKSLTNVDRSLYSKTAMESTVSKVVLTTGTASSITVNSAKLLVAANADFSGAVEYPFSFKASSSIEIPVTAASGSYYKFVFNVTVSSTSNKFIQFSKAEFYGTTGEGGGGVTPEPEDPVVPEDGIVWNLVEDVNDIKTGDEVIIVADGYDVALGALNKDYHTSTPVTVSDNTLTDIGDAVVLTIGKNGDYYTFSYDNKYLNWTSGNAMNTATAISENTSFTVAIEEGVTTISNVAGVSEGRELQYNASSPRFACYKGTQQSVCIYKKTVYHTLTVTEAGYATLFLDFNAAIPAEVEAYTVTEINNGYVTLTKVEGVLPAGTGIIVKAEAGDYKFFYEETATADVTGNLLNGSVEDTYVEGTAYVLANHAETGVGMYKAELNKDAEGNDGTTHFKNNAGKAYLVLPAEQSTAAFYGFDWNGTTGVEKVESRNEKSEIYDLTGRRVENPSNGIYIINGVKVLVK